MERLKGAIEGKTKKKAQAKDKGKELNGAMNIEAGNTEKIRRTELKQLQEYF